VTGSGRRYGLRVAGPGARKLDRLPDKVASAIVEFMLGALLDDPHRVGRPLRRELAGLHSARRGSYRVVYEISDETSTVTVLRVDHRSTIYRPR
jgi:mRNA interferase RelE/StbE